jgi:hypothetical protein
MHFVIFLNKKNSDNFGSFFNPHVYERLRQIFACGKKIFFLKSTFFVVFEGPYQLK